MAAIFFNESIQNLNFYIEKMFERFISNLKLVLAYFFSFKNMKNNKSSQNSGGSRGGVLGASAPPAESMVGKS